MWQVPRSNASPKQRAIETVARPARASARLYSGFSGAPSASRDVWIYIAGAAVAAVAAVYCANPAALASRFEDAAISPAPFAAAQNTVSRSLRPAETPERRPANRMLAYSTGDDGLAPFALAEIREEPSLVPAPLRLEAFPAAARPAGH